MSDIKSYRDLRVWQEAMELAEDVYRLTALFPREEIYGLTSQMRRCAVSVPSNIAEGYGRDRTGAYLQCLSIARGSLKELETQALIAARVDVCNPKSIEPLMHKAGSVGKMLNALMRALESKHTAK